jgi:hypothetical protein
VGYGTARALPRKQGRAQKQTKKHGMFFGLFLL